MSYDAYCCLRIIRNIQQSQSGGHCSLIFAEWKCCFRWQTTAHCFYLIVCELIELTGHYFLNNNAHLWQYQTLIPSCSRIFLMIEASSHHDLTCACVWWGHSRSFRLDNHISRLKPIYCPALLSRPMKVMGLFFKSWFLSHVLFNLVKIKWLPATCEKTLFKRTWLGARRWHSSKRTPRLPFVQQQQIAAHIIWGSSSVSIKPQVELAEIYPNWPHMCANKLQLYMF